VEASALPAPSGLARTRIGVKAPLLRLRTDEQLVAIFRAGNDEAFRVIYDRYQQRLFAYARQMLAGSRQDAEDALQDVFVRAYGGLLADDRQLSLRAWLYRIAHNRCIDQLRRPAPPAPEVLELVRPPMHDPISQAEQRETLRRLIQDVRRLPDQQRSALLMRELGGVGYAELSNALGVSTAAVKSLLVRARVGLASAAEARDTACATIREDLALAHDRGVRPSGTARRHLHDCAGCAEFRVALRGTSRQFAALFPALGPVAIVAKLLGVGGGASGGASAASVGTGGVASAGLVAGAGHVATLLAAAVITAGGAVEIQHQLSQPAHHRSLRAVQVSPAASAAPTSSSTLVNGRASVEGSIASNSTSSGTAARTAAAVHTAASASRTRQGSLAALAGSADNGAPNGSAGGSATGSSGTGNSPAGNGDPGPGASLPPVDTGGSTTPPPDGGVPGGTSGDGTTGTSPVPLPGARGGGGTAGSPPISTGTPPDASTSGTGSSSTG
jgi:RNA polymerase sigma factor (sigma-70 family)